MKKDIRYYWQRLGTLAIFVLLMVIMGMLSPQYFLSRNNIIQIFLQSSINVLIAIGVFFPILIAGIDLSVGSVLGLTGWFPPFNGQRLEYVACHLSGRCAVGSISRTAERNTGCSHQAAPLHYYPRFQHDL